MQTRNRLLDDLTRLADGAVSTVAGIGGEIDAMIRRQLERLLADMDMVPREEFEAVKAVAAKARTEQEKLEKRVAALEAGKATPAKPARAPRKRTPKASPKAE